MSIYLRKALFIFLAISLIGTGSFVYADVNQDKIEELRRQIEELEELAEQYRGNIAVTQAQANTLKNQIQNLRNQISTLETNIRLTGKKIDKTQVEIVGVQENIKTTQEKMDQQRLTIAQLIQYLAKRDNETLVGVLMKSDSLSDYFNQEQYALTVNSTLLSVVNDLKNTENQLEDQKTDLEGRKKSLEELRQQENAQKASLASVQAERNKVLTATKGQEAQYQKMLAEVEAKKSVFFTQLRELETQVIQGGLYLVHVKASADLPKSQKGLLEWPEDNPRITQGYGCTSYARCGRASGPYGGAGHNGVDMARGYGTPIKAVADGEIIANGKNDGYGNWIAIKHPTKYNLVSVYAHMSSLSFLQVGTEVKAGTVVGYEGSTGNSTGSHLHLSLYKEFFTYQNGKKGGQLYFNYFEGSVNPLNYL